jgi:hypothetical protein
LNNCKKKIVVVLSLKKNSKYTYLEAILSLIVFLFFNSVSILRLLFLQSKRLTKELKSINWKEVDEYPSVVDCEKIEDKNNVKSVF